MDKIAISYKAAQRCEDAIGETCKCRCGGKLHGAKRGNVLDLPKDDPHTLLRQCKYCKGKGLIYLHQCRTCKGAGNYIPDKILKTAKLI